MSIISDDPALKPSKSDHGSPNFPLSPCSDKITPLILKENNTTWGQEARLNEKMEEKSRYGKQDLRMQLLKCPSDQENVADEFETSFDTLISQSLKKRACLKSLIKVVSILVMASFITQFALFTTLIKYLISPCRGMYTLVVIIDLSSALGVLFGLWCTIGDFVCSVKRNITTMVLGACLAILHFALIITFQACYDDILTCENDYDRFNSFLNRALLLVAMIWGLTLECLNVAFVCTILVNNRKMQKWEGEERKKMALINVVAKNLNINT